MNGLTFSRALYVLCAVALIASAFVDSPSVNDLLFRVSMLVIVATSWNLMANAGLISLGHSAFWGMGSYASMLAITRLGLGLPAGLLLSIIAGALLGVLLAVATARLRGFFFAICTLGLSEGLRVIMLMLPDVTGGAVGVFLPQEAHVTLRVLFLLGAVVAVISVAIAAALSRTRFHYACRAMRNHERAAQMLGVDPRTYRTGVLALSGAMASCAGGISAVYGGYIDPSIAFNLKLTIESQIAPILGGMYTLAGPVIGSVFLLFLSESTRLLLGAKEGVSPLIYGAVLVLGILFMPKGVVGVWTRFQRRKASGAASPSNESPAAPVVKINNTAV